MKIQLMFAFGDGVFAAMVDSDGKNVGFETYGKDETRRVLKQFGGDEQERLEQFVADIDSGGMETVPDTATKPTVRHEGKYVDTLCRIAFAPAVSITGDRAVSALTGARNFLFFFMLPVDGPNVQAVVGHVDHRSKHFVTVLFSKSQLRAVIVKQFSWLANEALVRMRNITDASLLPLETPREVIIIDGNLATLLNSAYYSVRTRDKLN